VLDFLDSAVGSDDDVVAAVVADAEQFERHGVR
jgi:hypothetical protein